MLLILSVSVNVLLAGWLLYCEAVGRWEERRRERELRRSEYELMMAESRIKWLESLSR